MVGAECHEMRLVIPLKMWQLPSIKGLRHKSVCGDSRPRLSAERSSAGFDCRTAL